MKQIFTLAAAATVALGVNAAPRMMEKVDVPVSAMGTHRVMTTAARLANDLKAGIERPGVVKRSYREGNIEWTFVMVPGEPLFEYFYPGGIITDQNGNPTGETTDIEDIPYWGVECVLTGTNINNEREYAMFPLLLSYPCQYWQQFADYTGPLEEGADGQLYLPEDAIPNPDYSIMPFTALMDSEQLKPRFMDMNGYFQWTLGTADGHYAGNQYFGAFGFAGGHYGYNTAGNEYVLFTSTFDMDTNRNGKGSSIDFSFYSPDDNSTAFEANYYFNLAQPNTSTGRYEPTGASGETSVNFEGVGYFNGFESRTLDFPMSMLNIFNAGVLDYEEMGDSYTFWGYPEEPLQLYYIAGAGEGLEFGFSQENLEAIQKDGTFNKANITLGATDSYDETNFVTLTGYLFNKLETSFENNTYRFNPAREEVEIDPFTGEENIIADWVDPMPNTFVSRTRTTEGGMAEWSVTYGLAGTYFTGYYNYPTDDTEAYVATNTPNGFVVRYHDQYNNKVSYTFDGIIYNHPEYENMAYGEEIESVGDNPDGLGIQNIFNIFDSVKVSAKNGAISILSADNAPVQVINLNGQVVNNSKAVAGETLNVKADKGLYIVKVGKEVRKVVL
ncbi:MAG: T9SS type A sorting domain-containing protein [Bacteroides sp.]|nr:T9SS type A sorting domain-containing protein [Bacteroides sp.]